MGDLTHKQSASFTKITNEDETNIVKVSPEGELAVSNFANISFIDANKTITPTESLAAVGGSNLANRKTLVIFNRGNNSVYYGTSGVDDTIGIEIIKDELLTLNVGENVQIYLVTKVGNSTVTIQEFA